MWLLVCPLIAPLAFPPGLPFAILVSVPTAIVSVSSVFANLAIDCCWNLLVLCCLISLLRSPPNRFQIKCIKSTLLENLARLPAVGTLFERESAQLPSLLNRSIVRRFLGHAHTRDLGARARSPIDESPDFRSETIFVPSKSTIARSSNRSFPPDNHCKPIHRWEITLEYVIFLCLLRRDGVLLRAYSLLLWQFRLVTHVPRSTGLRRAVTDHLSITIIRAR